MFFVLMWFSGDENSLDANLLFIYLMCCRLATGRGFAVRVPVGSRIFSMLSRPALGPTQPPIQWLRGTIPSGVKRQGREADHSPPAITKVKKTSTPPDVFIVGWFIPIAPTLEHRTSVKRFVSLQFLSLTHSVGLLDE
jgi:hypothetical protein